MQNNKSDPSANSIDLPSRKADHIRINLEEDVLSSRQNGLDRYHFVHQALPEINLEDVDLQQELFGKQVMVPLLISSMTGGAQEASEINATLARAAQQVGAVMGVGSQRAALEHPDQASTFKVRQYAPDIVLFANLGAIQLNYGYTADHCRRAVDMIEADALILHLNPLQEALQSDGNTNFSGILKRIEEVCRSISVPVIAKEVGWGISVKAASMLAGAGVAAIDVAGAGGTSWSQVEMFREKDHCLMQVSGAFRDWGIATAESIQMVRHAAPGLRVFASGGLRNGVDVAKCLAMGACLGGLAGPFLKASTKSLEDTLCLLDVLNKQIRISMFACGASRLDELTPDLLVTQT